MKEIVQGKKMRSDSTGSVSINSEGGQSYHPAYVLITPARNEAAFIEQTIKSVIVQTVLPIKWVIVSDGSTDGTNDIVKRYANEYKWIEFVLLPERAERHFAGKVHAFNAGYAKVKNLNYDIIGNLDADISFGRNHFEFLLGKFAETSSLGVAGTAFIEDSSVAYNYKYTNIEHVSGQCQLFRRECFESIGGYVPLKAGAIDLTAVVTARMKGWQTRTFTEKTFIHHRRMGTAKAHILVATFKSGYGDYAMGVHPVWQLFRSVYQMSRKPVIFGGIILMAGYLWAMLTRAHKPVSIEFVRFRRKEQMRRLNEYLKKGFSLFSSSHH